MIIGIDLRPVNTGEKSGVEEYTVNLLRHLFFLDQKNEYKLFLSSFARPKLNFEKLDHFPNVKLHYFPYPSKLLNLGFNFLKYPAIDRILGGVDIFFSPNIIFNHLSPRAKQVVTFHDLSFERHPEFFSAKRRIWHKLVLPASQAQKAARVIAVSESTRQDLIDLYKVRPEKIWVIYSGVLQRFKPRNRQDNKIQEVKKKYHLPHHFILYLGTLEPRKNLTGLILAFNQIKKRGLRDYKLVIAGKPGWLYRDVYKLASESAYNRDIMFTGFISTEDKPYLYNLADLFVYPSFYEGFGFPPLEAMASGVPVITSHISSLPEVVAGAGLLINPYNVHEVAEAIFQVINDRELQVKLKANGLKQARKFNWRETAKKTLNLFETVHYE